MFSLDNQTRRCPFNYSEFQGNVGRCSPGDHHSADSRSKSNHLQFKIIVAFFKNKKGKRGIVIDPLFIEKHFKSYGERYQTKYLRFDGGSIRNHSAYKYFDTTGPLIEKEKTPKENNFELHDDNKNVQVDRWSKLMSLVNKLPLT